jgi:glyoxylase-like metal-dependent hydrolase (beta-lactamase superfamily II)
MLTTKTYEDVMQIKLGRRMGSTSVSTYLVDGLLIDSGLAYTSEELLDFLKTRKVKILVNTHYHEDHIGANYLLREKLGVKLFAHRLSTEKINQRPKLYPYQKEVWGYPVPTRPEAIGDRVVTDLFSFEVIHTPGHSPDHICLFERSRGWLFSGDLFHSTHPIVARPEENQWQILESLRLVKGLKPRILFTAPSDVVSEPEKVLDETVRYLEQLGKRIEDFNKKGLSSVEIRQEIFGEERPITAMTQEQFSSLNLILGFRY